MLSSNIPISLPDSARIPALGCKRPQSLAKSSAADTLARAQVGDHDAFSELYAQHKRRVFTICIRMVRDFALAEDLTQETFLTLHRKIATFRGDSAFTTWLHRLTVNTVLMHLRKQVLSVVSLEHLAASVLDERAERAFGTRDLAQAGAVDRLAIDRAVATLAPGYRSVLLLHDVEGFVHGEIASMLKCTCGTTKSQLHKARRALRGALSAHAGSGDRGSDNRGSNSFLQRNRANGPGRPTWSQDSQALSA
jgi:RNA polymerase sigma-70 factor, ECF subfamily